MKNKNEWFDDYQSDNLVGKKINDSFMQFFSVNTNAVPFVKINPSEQK